MDFQMRKLFLAKMCPEKIIQNHLRLQFIFLHHLNYTNTALCALILTWNIWSNCWCNLNNWGCFHSTLTLIACLARWIWSLQAKVSNSEHHIFNSSPLGLNHSKTSIGRRKQNFSFMHWFTTRCRNVSNTPNYL